MTCKLIRHWQFIGRRVIIMNRKLILKIEVHKYHFHCCMGISYAKAEIWINRKAFNNYCNDIIWTIPVHIIKWKPFFRWTYSNHVRNIEIKVFSLIQSLKKLISVTRIDFVLLTRNIIMPERHESRLEPWFNAFL